MPHHTPLTAPATGLFTARNALAYRHGHNPLKTCKSYVSGLKTDFLKMPVGGREKRNLRNLSNYSQRKPYAATLSGNEFCNLFCNLSVTRLQKSK